MGRVPVDQLDAEDFGLREGRADVDLEVWRLLLGFVRDDFLRVTESFDLV